MTDAPNKNQIELPIPDQAIRDSIERELDRSLLVEAAAGTGKTTCMVNRMIALLRDGKAETQDIAAITFTRKAAAQLRQKFQIGLEQAIPNENESKKKLLLTLALQNINRIFIGTVHSFCARLLRERPVEAGIDPNFTELDETNDLLLRDEYWKRFLEETFISGRSTLESLSNIGVQLSLLRNFFDKIVLYPEVEIKWEKCPQPDFSSVVSDLETFLHTTRKLYDPSPLDGRLDELQELCEKQYRLRQVTDINDAPQCAEWIAGFNKNVKIVQKLWLEKNAAIISKTRFDELLTTTIQPILKQWRQFCYPIIVQATLPAAKRLEQFRKESGLLNFQDLLLLTSRMLKKHSQVRQDFQNRFRFILVDEFQDTDPLQAEILFYFCGEPITEPDWRKLQIRPGSLFIVGDPKQSIYRFRRADIAIYQQVKELLLQSGGEVKTLQTNFRSHASICEWVNKQYETVFATDTSMYQATNVPLVPVRYSSDYPTGVFTLTTNLSKKSREQSSKEDAIIIARIIANWLANNTTIHPQDILLLVSEKKYIKTYLNELERFRIPCEVSGSNSFSDSEEFDQLLPLLRIIIEPDDEVSLVAFLQGPLCGISDEALYRFRVLQKGQFKYLLPTPTDPEESVKKAYELLRELHYDSSRLPAGAALSRMMDSVGLLPYTATKPLGKLKSGALMTLLTIARDKTAQGASFAEVVQSIIELKEATEVESMTLSPNRGKAVRVMNLHKAKGLEAPIVFLADPHESAKFEPDCVIERDASEPNGYFCVGVRENEFQTKFIAEPRNWDELQKRELTFADAERERLRYVGTTRAADCLIISRLEVQTKSDMNRFCQWVSKVDTLENLPEMRVTDESTITESTVHVSDTESTLFEELDLIATRKTELSQPTYQTSSVTAIIHPDGNVRLSTHSDADRGKPWGRVIHRVLAASMNDEPEISQKLDVWLSEEGLSTGKKATLIETIERVKKTTLWLKALTSKERYAELPFAIFDSSKNETIRGIIDLVFLSEGVWCIVDYKSDIVTGDDSERVKSYKEQVRLYTIYWELLTREKAKGYLLFTENSKIIEILPSSL